MDITKLVCDDSLTRSPTQSLQSLPCLSPTLPSAFPPSPPSSASSVTVLPRWSCSEPSRLPLMSGKESLSALPHITLDVRQPPSRTFHHLNLETLSSPQVNNSNSLHLPSSTPAQFHSSPYSISAPTASPNFVSQYFQSHAPQQRVECGLCGKSFSGISSHNRHVSRTHHKARPFSCADCGLQFGQKGSLDRHTAAVHLKARPFSCDYCGKGFGRKDNMKIHMTTVHLKRKPFKCDMCPKSFGGKRPLKIHRQTVHFKERPLQCPYCDKRFGQRSNLNVHIKVHKRCSSSLPPIVSPPHSPLGSVDEGGRVSESERRLPPLRLASVLDSVHPVRQAFVTSPI